MRNWIRSILMVFVCSVSALALGQEPPAGRLLRFPDIYGNQIVFSYGGDLWLVASTGGVARRITTHPGLELFPKFSPDGKWIAFTAQYDGNFNVYVIPSEGGIPRQLTFAPDVEHVSERMGPNNMVIDWTPDGKSIVFLSRRYTFNTWFGQLFTVPVTGGLPQALPLPKGGLLSYSPDGSTIAYNRIFRNFRTWKRYTGGMAQDIWTYDFKTRHLERLTDYAGTDTFPMWHGETIYFDSDRGPDHLMNLYAYNLRSKQTRAVTDFKEYDVNWPSLGPDSIVFENGGELYVLDLKSHKTRAVNVQVPGDEVLARPHWARVSKLISSMDLSPEGKRALFTARGDVFTVPAEKGSIRNLTETPGIREKYAAWSPDGKWVAYMSDRTGEDELYLRPQEGGPEVRITHDGKVFRLAPVWSPDSQKLLFADKSLRLYYVDIQKKTPVLIDQGKYADLTYYRWSPDSQWVAYAKAGENNNDVVYLYSLASGKITPVTTSFTESWNPVFDPGGKYLYFLSNRSYNEVLGVYDMEFSNPKATRIYVVTLRSDLPSPFAPESDEAVTSKKPAAEKEKSAEEKKEEALKNFRIDLEGIQERVVALPIPAGSLEELDANAHDVFYVSEPVSGLSGPLAGESPAIRVFDMAKRKDHELVAGATSYALSFNGKKLLYAAPAGPGGGGGDEAYGGEARSFGIVDAAPPEGSPHKVGDGALNLASMRMEVVPHQEWRQIFNEAWRQERDYFFEPSMNGVNWEKEHAKYAPLLPFVSDRYDLTYLIGEMIGDLSNSHTYVGGGDYPNLHPVNVGMLGVDFETDTASGLYRFKKIYPGQNWDSSLRSPLTEPGVDVHAGDYLLAINGHALKAPENPYKLFINTVGQNVTLTVNSKPSEEGARQVVVRPIASEIGLRELNWIETNRRKVDEATHGKVGYVYLPDMSEAGLNEFVKQYFPQIRKEGIIFDVRYNGGGFVDQLIFHRLRRILAAMGTARNFQSSTEPDMVFYGYMACVTNHYAASDGDFFTYFFKKYKLGPVIGTRTWGGVRGIRGYIPLMDGGYITRPEFSLYGLDSHWIIENHGVAPDVTVDNTPDQVMAGKDPQLEKAIQMVMQEIREHPKKLPPRPADLPAYPSGPGM